MIKQLFQFIKDIAVSYKKSQANLPSIKEDKVEHVNLNMVLVREFYTTESTIDMLYINDVYECYILEDRVRNWY